jgi:hypothetical protein
MPKRNSKRSRMCAPASEAFETCPHVKAENGAVMASGMSAIYWMKTKDVYPDGGYDDTFFMAFDPEVRFPRFHMETGDETIGTVHRITGGPENGLWQWSMTVSLPGPRYGRPTNGRSEKRSDAARAMIECYRHYLSTRPMDYQKRSRDLFMRD